MEEDGFRPGFGLRIRAWGVRCSALSKQPYREPNPILTPKNQPTPLRTSKKNSD